MPERLPRAWRPLRGSLARPELRLCLALRRELRANSARRRAFRFFAPQKIFRAKQFLRAMPTSALYFMPPRRPRAAKIRKYRALARYFLRAFLSSRSSFRAAENFTNFLISAAGNGLSTGN